MRKSIVYFFPVLMLLVFLLDAQLSTLLTNLAPEVVSITSHLLLMIAIFVSLYVSVTPMMLVSIMIGFIYDIYYLDVIGLSTTLLPLVIYIVYYIYQNMAFRRITNYILLFVMVFTFEFGSFVLARLFQLTNLSMFIFVVYNLLPSLIFNIVLFMILSPLLESLFAITNKT